MECRPFLSTKGPLEYNRMRSVSFVKQQSLAGQGLPIVETSRSHSDTPHLVGLLWTSDQSDAEISTWQHTTLKKTKLLFPPGFSTTILYTPVPSPVRATCPTHLILFDLITRTICGENLFRCLFRSTRTLYGTVISKFNNLFVSTLVTVDRKFSSESVKVTYFIWIAFHATRTQIDR